MVADQTIIYDGKGDEAIEKSHLIELIKRPRIGIDVCDEGQQILGKNQ